MSINNVNFKNNNSFISNKAAFKGIDQNTFRDFHRKRQQISTGNKPQKHAKDPYMQYPTRGLAYTNEVGVALQPAIGAAKALGFWVPALGYFAADIHDKYKKGSEEKTNDHRTGLRQAIFHAAASVVGPTLAIHLAQEAGMEFGGAKWANKTHEKILKGESKIAKFTEKLPFIGKKLAKSFANHNQLTQGEASKGVMKYINKIPIIGSNPAKEFERLTALGIKAKGAKSLANAFKTVVGFAALALVAIPIDIFTEKIIIKKVVNPALGLKDQEHGK